MRRNKPLELYRNLSPAVKTALWFTLCNFLQKGTSLITTPIFTRVLTTDEYGLCNIYFTWFELFAIFSTLKIPYEGLNNGLIRFEEDKERYVSSAMGLMMTLTALTAGIYWVFHPWIDHFTKLSSVLMIVLFVHQFCNPGLFLWINRERFDFRYRYPVIVTITSTILAPAIALYAVLHTSYRAEARILGTAGVQCFFGLICIIIIFARGKTFFHKEYWKFSLCFNLPLVFYHLSQIVLAQSDRLMINYYNGTGKAGIYSVAYTAGTLMHLIVTAINGSLNPWIYKKLKAKKEREIGTVVLSLLLLMAAGTAAMSAFAPVLVDILAPKTYQEALQIIPPVAASEFFIFFYIILANIEMYFGENRYISFVSIATAIANILLNAVCIPRFGYLAAGWTTLVCYLMAAVLHYLLMLRACRRNGIKQLLPNRWMILTALAVVGMTFLMLASYSCVWLRWTVLGILVLGGWLLRKPLWNTLKHIRK